MRSAFITLAAASALAFAAAPAAAQSYRQSRPYAAPQPPYGAAPYGYACRQMCPMDVTPCDPPQCKIADGRCAATSPESSLLSGRPPPLQNRVDPFGDILAAHERGEMYGNRGGRFHRDDRTLGSSRWKSKMWISCRLQFKGRRNDVFGKRYTDLFFADEPTALAAGHRPCFYCRRDAANAFIAALGDPALDRAPKLDARLDAERRTGHTKRLQVMNIDALPDGAMFAEGERAFAVKGDAVLEWSFGGYVGKRARPVGMEAQVLTPPTSLLALHNGYAPEWHSSAL